MVVSRLFWRASPLIILLFGYGLVVWPQVALTAERTILHSLPYILAIVLVVFAGLFNRCRFILPVASILFFYWMIQQRLQTPLLDQLAMNHFIGVNLVLCCQLLFAALIPEKGLFNRWGLAALIVAALPAVMLWQVGHFEWLAHYVFSMALQSEPISVERFWLTEFLLIVQGGTGLLLLLLAVVRHTATEYALILTWMVGAVVFYDFAQPDMSAIGCTALMVALFVVFLQSNYQITFIDTLTNIPARRAMEDYLPTLGRLYTIAMLDVDHFKKFNDIFGHDVGDQVLKMVASRINQVGGGGRAFRYGGEEFTVIFNRKNASSCFAHLEAVRLAVQNHEMVLRRMDREQNQKKGKQQRGRHRDKKDNISVTISIGVSNSAPGLSPTEVIKLADDNLYRAKKKGRNQTCMPVNLD